MRSARDRVTIGTVVALVVGAEGPLRASGDTVGVVEGHSVGAGSSVSVAVAGLGVAIAASDTLACGGARVRSDKPEQKYTCVTHLQKRRYERGSWPRIGCSRERSCCGRR